MSPSARKKVALWGGIVLVAIALIVGLRACGGADEEDGGAPAGRGGGRADTLAVTVAPVRQEVLEDRLTTTGTLLPWEAVELRAEVSGRITRIAFAEGAFVRTGQTLVTLDTGVLAARIEAVRTRRDLAAVQAARRRELFGIGGLARQELDAAEADVRVLDAELAQLRAEADRLRIVAPFSGQIGLREVSLGAFVGPGDRIATLRATDRLRLEFSVPERYLGRVRPGDTVEFTVPGQDAPFAARVTAAEPSVDAGSRAFTVRAEVRNPGGVIVPGSFAEVAITLDRVPDALMIPASSIVVGADSTTVYIVQGGQAQPRAVTTGIRTADAVQITSGLSAADVVLTSGLDEVRPGQAVRVGGAFDPTGVRPDEDAPEGPTYERRAEGVAPAGAAGGTGPATGSAPRR